MRVDGDCEENREYEAAVERLKQLIDVENITGLGEYGYGQPDLTGKRGMEYQYWTPKGKVFLVIRGKTIEVRCDKKLGAVLREKYESVMESRYFGKGGIEIVVSGQLDGDELADLVRLSYNLTAEMEE